MSGLSPISMDALLERYHLLLFDAYGVLVRGEGVIEGARALVEHLNTSQRQYYILTNDASRHISTSHERFAQLGLSIPIERIITSGSLLVRYFKEQALGGAKTVTLGPPDSHQYALDAGASLIKPWELETLEVLIFGDMPTEEPVRWLEESISALLRTLDAGLVPKLVLPNPDLIYPKDTRRVGLTAGAIAAMFEHIIRERYPGIELKIDRLGKPHPYIFEEGMVRAGHAERADTIMVGDQLVTDIQGARDFGIDSALVTTGLVRADQDISRWPLRPTFVLESLWS